MGGWVRPEVKGSAFGRGAPREEGRGGEGRGGEERRGEERRGEDAAVEGRKGLRLGAGNRPGRPVPRRLAGRWPRPAATAVPLRGSQPANRWAGLLACCLVR